MADFRVDLDRAMTSEVYAAQCIRRGCDAKTRCRIAAHWGADKVKLWESVDSTKYIIDEDDLNNIYDESRRNVESVTGHDGSAPNPAGSVATAAGGTAVALSGYLGTRVAGQATEGIFRKEAGNLLSKKVASSAASKGASKAAAAGGDKAAQEAAGKSAQQKQLGAYATVVLAAVVAAKYWIESPNKKEYKAGMDLYGTDGSGLLVDGQGELEAAQEDMINASEEAAEYSEDAEERNEEANDSIKDDKTKFDFYRAQYEGVKAKAAKGIPLSKDDKNLLKSLAPLMEDLTTNIADTQEETSGEVNDLYDEIEGLEYRYDEGAGTIARVTALTDFGEQFDESSRLLMNVEAVGQGLNAAGAVRAALQLSAGGPWNWAFAAIGYAAAASSGIAMGQQLSMAGDMTEEIHYRRDTQDLGFETQDVYDNELDNFTGAMEFVDDLELEIPDDLDLPEAPDMAGGEDGGSDGLFVPPAGDGNGDGDGIDNGGGGNGGQSGTPLEKDPTYVNNMGYGGDWHEVASGNISRDDDSKIVTDSSGKVILIQAYCNAIMDVTGVKEGEYFSKDNIPKILEKLLGYPFDEKMIKKVHNGHKLSDEYVSKILGTKNQDDKGSKTTDNSERATAMAKKVIDFYWPIFEKASTKGWVKG